VGYSDPTQTAATYPPAGEYPVEFAEEEEQPGFVVISPPRRPAAFDWVTWLLALLALVALGGLIPFWLWVIYLLSPPV